MGLRPRDFTQTQGTAATHSTPDGSSCLTSGLDPNHGASHQIYELLEGKTLDQLTQVSLISIPPRGILFVGQSLDAVEALHEAGWIHGDLNADNFLCVDSEIQSSWKLLELPFLSVLMHLKAGLRFSAASIPWRRNRSTAAPTDARSDLICARLSLLLRCRRAPGLRPAPIRKTSPSSVFASIRRRV